MKKIAVLVHGFNVSDNGEKTVDRMQPFLEAAGYEVLGFDYDWTGVIKVRFCNNNLAKALASVSKYFSDCYVVAFGHSNGCSLIHKAATYHGANFNQVVYLNPALDKDATLARQIEFAHVWHSPSDVPVKIARWFIGHSWGEMGATGYRGQDPRYRNYNKEKGYRVVSNEHSDIFEYKKLRFFMPEIIKEVTARIPA